MQSKIRGISKGFYDFFTGVYVMLLAGGGFGTILGIIAFQEKQGWANTVLAWSIPILFLGIIVAFIMISFFEEVRKGALLLYSSDDYAVLKKNFVFWRRGLKKCHIIPSNDTNGTVSVAFEIIAGIEIRQLVITIKYIAEVVDDSGPGLQHFSDDYEARIAGRPNKAQLLWENFYKAGCPPIKKFVKSLLLDFKTKYIADLAKLCNPYTQQDDLVVIIRTAELQALLNKTGLSIQDAEFYLVEPNRI